MRLPTIKEVIPYVREFGLLILFVWAVSNESLIGIFGVLGVAILTVGYNIARNWEGFLMGCRIMEFKIFGRTFDKQEGEIHGNKKTIKHTK